jgi:CRISPR-associated protein Cas2
MMVLVTYDVRTDVEGGQKRLHRVAKVCESYGQRVQKSVFECVVDPAQWTMLRQSLIDEIKVEEDSLRFYFMGSNWKIHIEHMGVKLAYEQEEPMVL